MCTARTSLVSARARPLQINRRAGDRSITERVKNNIAASGPVSIKCLCLFNKEGEARWMEKSICISFKTNEKQKETKSRSLIEMREREAHPAGISLSSIRSFWLLTAFLLKVEEFPDPPPPAPARLSPPDRQNVSNKRRAARCFLVVFLLSLSHQKQRNLQRARTCMSVNITGCQSSSNNRSNPG